MAEKVSVFDKVLLAPLEFAALGFTKRVERWARDLRYPDTTEIWLAKGYCIPARGQVLTALNPFGVDVVDQGECLMPNPETPLYIDAWVRVRDAQAEWAEYLLMRSGHFQITSPPLNRRNEEWARKHNGSMPTPWADKEPWVEAGCSGGATKPPPRQAGRQRTERSRPERPRRERRPRP